MARCGCGGGACNCSIDAGSGVTVSGSGTPANPFVISATALDCAVVRPCISAGQGATYNSGTGVVAARPSTDAGNTIQFGGDGGLYAATHCPTVRQCLSEGDGIDYNPATGVISARPSTDAGNNLAIGGDGGLFVPTGAATVTTGCGLTGNGAVATPVRAQVGTWAYPCDLDDHAGQTYCDSAGVLRGEPRGQATFDQSVIEQSYPSLAVPAGTDVLIETRPFDITNPDPCRDAFVVFECELDVDFTLPAGAGAAASMFTDDIIYMENTGSSTQDAVHVQVCKVFLRTVPAGGVLASPIEVRMGRGSGGAAYTRIQTATRAFIFNL
ncbi:hypothetical protein GCM10010387_15360 [Streptomyces inusitatus]|uniref:Uncharacterized protein n=1 Tax=Streptomyces inusitatus TaxID=68221 RepID=A0A918PUI9_9ACTN|nr:hypothetical protein [Streptomyces inusitatus]GGZ23181.1 hypothetical protein GCM10010387_15360 [Streptomyces inusitatus]